MEEEVKEVKEVRHHWSKKEILIGVVAIVATIGLCVAGVYYRDSLMNTMYLQRFGLLGVLVVAFIAGSTFSVTAIPVPYWVVVFTLPGLMSAQWGWWSAIWVGLVSALGASLGQLITFMIGYGGRGLSEKLSSKINSKLYDRAMNWAQRHGSWAVFLMSAMVNPLHLPMTIAIATLRYPPHKFFIFCFLGVAVKSLVIAFCGYFGFTSLFTFLGPSG
jgi:membrane protein DedA with SNARE-associated domain